MFLSTDNNTADSESNNSYELNLTFLYVLFDTLWWEDGKQKLKFVKTAKITSTVRNKSFRVWWGWPKTSVQLLLKGKVHPKIKKHIFSLLHAELFINLDSARNRNFSVDILIYFYTILVTLILSPLLWNWLELKKLAVNFYEEREAVRKSWSKQTFSGASEKKANLKTFYWAT